MESRIAVVTGGNKGIGFGVVRALCKQLPNGIVYLTSRDEERGKAAVEELKKENLNPRFHYLDINDKKSITRLSDYLVKEYGGLDILVNNAGICSKMDDTTPISTQVPVIISTNYYAQMDVCHTLFPILRPNARVCNVASMAGPSCYAKLSSELKERFKNASNEEDVSQLMQESIVATQDGTVMWKDWAVTSYKPHKIGYHFSKLGLITLTRIQANEADKLHKDILINCCCPGYVQTTMNTLGHLTIDEGAVNPTYLSLLPSGAKEPQGKFIRNMQDVYNFW